MLASSSLTARSLSHLQAGPRPVTSCPQRSLISTRRHGSRLASTQQTGQSRNDMEELGNKAAKTFNQWGEQAQESFKRTWTKLNSEYEIEEKAAKAAKKAEEAMKDVDQTYNVRRRLRNAAEYLQKKWPVWSAQLDAFATTWYGKATLLLVLLAIMSSPLFWRALNLLLIVWWLAIPVAAALLQAAQRRAAQRAQEEAEERARARNPFADMFARARSSATAGGGSGGAGGRSGGGRWGVQQSGPVIDAEYVVIKEDKGK
eukprot:CAMPEP_0202859538 /NCGR_PEP_ID=MMETSP1391-20130828/1603_1 /ASSEMBLY_ACC=CAM_ASM_000867 /TAXON_ID=1034604 /ORGANISM="Chlamydomonas leiostraca, Strain SAG 11-49" /LENGTH=258 /DNA_ID=CAMNT_0049538575 /DNA_START=47 /DNA_END=823 /DNA_ORIENTATION=+